MLPLNEMCLFHQELKPIETILLNITHVTDKATHK